MIADEEGGGGEGDGHLHLEQVDEPVDFEITVIERDNSVTIGERTAAVASNSKSTRSAVLDHGALAKKKAFSFLEISQKIIPLCEIPTCRVKCDRLTYASSSILAYYGLKDKDKPVKVKICSRCREKGVQFEKKSVEAIRKKESIFIIEHEPQPKTVVIDDDENGDESIPFRQNREEVEVDFDRGDVEGIVKNILKKIDIKDQMAKCKGIIMEDVSTLETEMMELDDEITSVEDMLYDTCRRYNRHFDKRPKPVVVQEVEINADGSMRQRNIVSDDVFVNRESMKKLAGLGLTNKSDGASAETSAQGGTGIVEATAGSVSSPQSQDAGGGDTDVLNQSIIVLADARKPGPASKTGYYEALDLDAQRSGPFVRKVQRPPELRPKLATKLLATPKLIPRIQPKAGDIVFAMYKNLLHFWLKGEVLEVVTNEMTNQAEFIVHFEPMRNGRPTGGVEGDGIERLIRQLCLKQMAVNVPCPFILPVGTRIIAKFKSELTADPETDGQYYAGVVAEPPKDSSLHRYLIFFDDGYAQYVDPADVLLVCESDKQVWNDVFPDSYDFVKEYVTKYPNWPMVKLHVGCLVATEWNGRWLPARILKVDSCLALARFENDGREEWIYRGSTRFRPIYRLMDKQEELRRERQQESHSKENKIPRHDPDQFKNRNQPAVEYKCESNGTFEALLTKGARKSTGRRQYYEELEQLTGAVGLAANHINMLDPDLCIEFQGSLTKIKIPEEAPKPNTFAPHDCDSSCVIEYVPSNELKRKSPLAIPFFFGWTREVCSKPRHVVFYRAPCGVRLRDNDELAHYLDNTDANLSIDFFCYDYDVDCLNEFVPARSFVNIKDISYGKEGAPVQCINSIDYEPLPFMDYTPARINAPGVNVNTDEDFLVCCDCTDNCEDKSKCACWNLTTQGIAFTKLNDEHNPTQGYHHRRLKDHVVSGIYECSSRCKCRKTCSNRVVQNGVQWPMQIFKTTKKGWGIRTVYDMPEGTFICIYSGQLMTDGMANEEGKDKGDEYLAELDYIECNEGVKEDYESDITDIEDEEDDSDSDEDMDKVVERKKGKKKKTRREADEMDDGSEDADVDSELENDDQKGDAASAKTSQNVVGQQQQRKLATRRTTGQKKYLDVDVDAILNDDDDMITARPSNFGPKISSSRKRRRLKHRDLYGPMEQVYIMDAKSKGNIGRYLNHSCRPNVFVQNVFVDTHDLRFPLVAFFTNTFVKAGSELTWDYHYNIGSVPGKVLYCFCMSPYCRGRLL